MITIRPAGGYPMADAIQYGRCTNKARCSLAFNKEKVFVPLDGRCPECGQPLEVESMAQRRLKLLPLIVVLALLGAGGYYAKTRYLDKAPDDAANARRTAAADRGTGDLPPDARRTAMGGQNGANVPPAPDDMPPGGAVDRPNFGLENDANAKARRDVLARIDRMPHLTDAQKTKLTNSVDRARGMGCIFIIPFAQGKKVLGPKETDILVSGFQSASIQKLLEDPTLVFVVLGYSDKQGDPGLNEKASIDRAMNVQSIMHDKCDVKNVMYSVGMGGSTMFDGKSPAKNRIVEIWAVYP